MKINYKDTIIDFDKGSVILAGAGPGCIDQVSLKVYSAIKQADVISIHIPNMPLNDNFMDKKKLSWMKNEAVLINTARANLVNEEDLYLAISKGKIRAAFDVFWNEPYSGKLTTFYPDSFYMSPHIASSSADFFLGCRNDLDKMIQNLMK